MYMYIYIYVGMYVCMYVCMYLAPAALYLEAWETYGPGLLFGYSGYLGFIGFVGEIMYYRREIRDADRPSTGR